MRNRPEIDGLRAVAIIPVLLYHAKLGLNGGFVGVDVFFVISGYLITALILNAIDGHRFSMIDFWERRIRRIFPPLAGVVIASLVVGWCLFLPRDLKMFGESVVAQALLASNVLFSLQTGYFADSNEFMPLLHTWSLAIEEQFYLGWPLLLWVMARYARPHLGWFVIFFGILSFSLNLYLTAVYPKAAFFLLPGRAWELLIGCYLAVAPPPQLKDGILKEGLSVAGLLAIVVAIVFYGAHTPFPGLAAAVPCLGTALLIWTNNSSLSGVGKLLVFRPLVFVGWISYSLYLWHWPLLVFGKYFVENCALTEMTVPVRLGILALSLPLAVCSWRFVETPIRKGARLKSRLSVFAVALIVTVVFVLIGLAFYVSKGVPARVSLEVQKTADIRQELQCLPNVQMTDAVNGDFVELGVGDKQQPVEIVLWGDSHASALVPVLDALCKARRVRGVAAVHYLTPPLLGLIDSHRFSRDETFAAAFNASVIAFIRIHQVKDVILMAHWERYLSEAGPENLEFGLRESLKQLRASGARVWIVKQVPAQPFDVPTALGCTLRFGRDVRRIGVPLQQQEKAAEQQSLIFERCKQADVNVLDPTRYFVNAFGLCAAVADGYPLYGDKTHLTARGAFALYPMFNLIDQ